MNTKMGLRLCALGAVALACAALPAAEPAQPSATGHVLVLANERILEGEIERQGDQYRVRRKIGETCVPADIVLCLCGNREEAYAYLGARANLRDPDERLRLARWCQWHGLRSQALAEATAALDLRPHHPETQRLLQNLQRSPQAAADKNGPGHKDPEPSETSEPRLPSIELTAEAQGMFATRVQPILMNTCASCHASGRADGFKLTRTFGSASNRRATQQNLAAVLAQINSERPQASPLLVKAISVHGDAEHAPLKGRQTPAYHMLEEWVRLVVANPPAAEGLSLVGSPSQMAGGRLPSPPAASKPQSMGDSRPEEPDALPATRQAEPSAKEAAAGGGQWAVSRNEKSAPQPAIANAPTTQPLDPFDPVIFNQQMHPGRR